MSKIYEEIREYYHHFAEYEVVGRSASYRAFCHFVCESDAAQEFIAHFPKEKRQPNLVIAATRKICGVPQSKQELEAAFARHGTAISEIVLTHRTQTNEPARCAATLLALAELTHKPLALIEVGAAAGLCLLLEQYHYKLGALELAPAEKNAPLIECKVEGNISPDLTLPQVPWRRGIDIAPIDLRDPEARDWLELLVWPEQDYRLPRLHGAMALAQKQALEIRKGHFLDHLQTLIADAPAECETVVYHSAVMMYPPRDEVDQFVEIMRAANATWICQEGSYVFDDSKIPAGRFGLWRDETLIGHAHPHGADVVLF